MSKSTTLILLAETAYVNPGDSSAYTVTGNAFPAASYYLSAKNLQTINLKLNNCTANVTIEATLSTTPTSNDWFKVYELVANTNAMANTPEKIASTTNTYANIQGNFVYVRAKVNSFQSGIIEYIKVNY